MVLPPHTLSKTVIETIRQYTHAMARELKVIGLMNVQYAVKGEKVYVLEVNPRDSRTVPFVSKAIGQPLAKLLLARAKLRLDAIEDALPLLQSIDAVPPPPGFAVAQCELGLTLRDVPRDRQSRKSRADEKRNSPAPRRQRGCIHRADGHRRHPGRQEATEFAGSRGPGRDEAASIGRSALGQVGDHARVLTANGKRHYTAQ